MNTFKHHTFTPLYRNEAGWFTVPDVEALANAYWTLYPAERGNSDLSPFEHWLARYNSSADPASGAIGTVNWYGKVTHALFLALFDTKAPRTRKEIIAALSAPDSFAVFNHGPHLAVDVPDGLSTITARTSSGKRITFAFVPYAKGAEASCVDVQYHDSGRTIPNGGRKCKVFHSIGFTVGTETFDTRKIEKETGKPTTLLTVLIDPKEYPAK